MRVAGSSVEVNYDSVERELRRPREKKEKTCEGGASTSDRIEERRGKENCDERRGNVTTLSTFLASTHAQGKGLDEGKWDVHTKAEGEKRGGSSMVA